MTHHQFIEKLANEFELAFIATGLVPVNRAFGDSKNDACLITVLDVSEYGRHKEKEETIWEWILCKKTIAARVQQFLQDKYGGDDKWWSVFISYLILSYDHMATFPRRWIERTNFAIFHQDVSPKLMGAAVGGLLRIRLLLQPAIKQPAPQLKLQSQDAQQHDLSDRWVLAATT